jgi:hypothetical protein
VGNAIQTGWRFFFGGLDSISGVLHYRHMAIRSKVELRVPARMFAVLKAFAERSGADLEVLVAGWIADRVMKTRLAARQREARSIRKRWAKRQAYVSLSRAEAARLMYP